MRNTDELLAGALAVIDEAFSTVRGVRNYAPLFSGGHDSYCATWVAAHHPRFDGNVYHIDTGIGSKATRAFVEGVCREERWRLNVVRSPWESLEWFVRRYGMPGPGQHGAVYRTVKDRALRTITKRGSRRHHRTMFVTGCRSQESVRRMGHVEKIKVGTVLKSGKVDEPHRIWVAPCHDWSAEEQRSFMDDLGLPHNPVKMSILGMSGECFCGCFARPFELEAIREVCPDVAVEIDRLCGVARSCGKPEAACTYGGPRRPGKMEVLETGPLCTSCDNKAAAAGIEVRRAM